MKRNMNPIRRNQAILAVLGAAAVVGLTTAFMDSPKVVQIAVDDRPVTRTGTQPTSYSAVVKKVTPSVVKVMVTSQMKRADFQGLDQLDHPLLRRFFGENPEFYGPQRRLPMPRQQGIGSGVIVTQDGYLLTNHHVIDGADEVKVALQDGREFNAKVVGKDPPSDIAVLKINADDLPYLELANSDHIEVGDVVLAIGNPFGLGQTVTMGIISATGRASIGLDYEDFIQTDAPINPGNSGGALVDTDGRLIGINTAILSRTGGNQGIGFAIPAALAHNVMTSLIKDGRVARGYLGITIQDLTPALAQEFDLKNHSGALVGEVKSDGPAAQAGLKSGDIIVEYDGKPITDSRQLKLRVADTKPGSKAEMQILRDGKPKNLTVRLKELPGTSKLAKAKAEANDDTGVLNGVGVSDLDPQIRRGNDLPQNLQGALVTEVDPSSPAAEAGLKPGDVIVEINRKPVHNADQAVKLTESTTDKTTLLKIWSQGGIRYLVVDENQTG